MRLIRWLSSSPWTCFTARRCCATTMECRSGASSGGPRCEKAGAYFFFQGDEPMDIRVYFQKFREIERNIQAPYVVVISLETPEGGKPGRATEVARESAAKL